MAHFKNQNKFHATLNGKRTLCGLSNGYKDALSIERFDLYNQNPEWIGYCCEKCSKSINK